MGRCARLGSQGTAVTFINESSRGALQEVCMLILSVYVFGCTNHGVLTAVLGLFLRLVEVLQPTGTVVPPEVLQSHHLQLQRERRASQQAEERGGGKEHKDVNIHDQYVL